MKAAWRIVAPRVCAVCGNVLAADEDYVCRLCLGSMPLTRYEGREMSGIEQRFAGKVPIVRSYGHFFYHRGDKFGRIIRVMKYDSMPGIGVWMGNMVARHLKGLGFFDDINCIMPVPMHWRKIASRGYNQSERIAQGVSNATGLPVKHNLVTVAEHTSLTRKSRMQRWDATQGLYGVEHAEELHDCHILLVDDVVTTGATLCACAKALLQCPGVRVSVLALAVTDNDF